MYLYFIAKFAKIDPSPFCSLTRMSLSVLAPCVGRMPFLDKVFISGK